MRLYRLALVLLPGLCLLTLGTTCLGDTHLTAVGDSVMLGAEAELNDRISDVRMDAQVSRQVSAGIEVVREMHDEGELTDTVVIGLGSNGTFTVAQFDELMALLVDVDRVYFVNVRVPRAWEDTNNQMLAENIPRYANAHLIDWYAATEDHPEYLYDDGVHLRPAGAEAYADLVVAALK